MKKILFVTHDATRTGAPIQLFWIAKWFKNHNYKVVVIIIYERGELIDEYKQNFEVYIMYKRNVRFNLVSFKLNYIIKKHKPDLFFTNTIISGEVINYFLKYNKPIISRVPEMMFTINQYGYEKYFKPIIESSSIIIIPSEYAKLEILEKNPEIGKKVEVISGFVPPNIQFEKNIKQKKLDEINVLMCGVWGWRKGSDLFLACAKHVSMKYNDLKINFNWVGLSHDTAIYNQVLYDIKKLNIQNVNIYPMVNNMEKYYKNNDVFLMTSREDPMPIVGLEAAANGLPIICFNKTGGMVDFVKDTSNSIIDYGNIINLSEEVVKYYYLSNKEYIEISKKTLDESKKYSHESIMKKIEEIVLKTMLKNVI